MKILLVGEYSHLHNTLKKGISLLGHEAVIIGDGDGFKNFPVDISIKPKFSNNLFIKNIKIGIYKIFKIDLGELERGIRFYFQLSKLKNFDVVQLINEKPIKTTPTFEKFLLKKIFENNNKILLLSSGVDFISVNYMLQKKPKYSLMNPYFKNKKIKKTYQYIFNYLTTNHKKTHEFVFQNIEKVIENKISISKYSPLVLIAANS